MDCSPFDALVLMIEALRARDCGPATSWCEQHRSKLKKTGLSLEQELLMQQIVELTRTGRKAEALHFIRHNLGPRAVSDESFALVVRRASTAVALGPSTRHDKYASLYSESRWTSLTNSLMTEWLASMSVPQVSLERSIAPSPP